VVAPLPDPDKSEEKNLSTRSPKFGDRRGTKGNLKKFFLRVTWCPYFVSFVLKIFLIFAQEFH